jgi:hypothetical protein
MNVLTYLINSIPFMAHEYAFWLHHSMRPKAKDYTAAFNRRSSRRGSRFA